jgi:hypothetical protein
MIQIDDRYGPFVGVALKNLGRQLERDGYQLPENLQRLAADLLDPKRDVQRRARLLARARSARLRARRRALRQNEVA